MLLHFSRTCILQGSRLNQGLSFSLPSVIVASLQRRSAQWIQKVKFAHAEIGGFRTTLSRLLVVNVIVIDDSKMKSSVGATR